MRRSMRGALRRADGVRTLLAQQAATRAASSTRDYGAALVWGRGKWGEDYWQGPVQALVWGYGRWGDSSLWTSPADTQAYWGRFYWGRTYWA